jgi:rhodanese-related sulfurtransferase
MEAMSFVAKRLVHLIILLVIPAVALWTWAAERDWKMIRPQALQEMLGSRQRPVLVDTMSYLECRDHSIPGSLCISSEEFESKIAMLPADKNKAVVFYCESEASQRSFESADAAVKRGYTSVFVLEGGIPAWKRAGYEVATVERIPRMAIQAVTPQVLRQWLTEKRDILLLDIRPEKAFNQAHIKGAVNIPIYQLHRRYEELPLNRLLILVDNRGFRTLIAASYLKRKGFQVKRLFGGMAKWEAMLSKEKKNSSRN